MWWIYFDEPAHHRLVGNRAAFVRGYGHLIVFAWTAAVSAGLGALFLASLWAVRHLGSRRSRP